MTLIEKSSYLILDNGNLICGDIYHFLTWNENFPILYYVTSQPSQPKSFQYQLTFTEIFADISAYQGEFTIGGK